MEAFGLLLTSTWKRGGGGRLLCFEDYEQETINCLVTRQRDQNELHSSTERG